MEKNKTKPADKKGRLGDTKEFGGEMHGILFGFDRRNKSSQLWAGPSKWGQVNLIIPKFKVLPAHPSQSGFDASRLTANDGDLNVPRKLVKCLARP